MNNRSRHVNCLNGFTNVSQCSIDVSDDRQSKYAYKRRLPVNKQLSSMVADRDHDARYALPAPYLIQNEENIDPNRPQKLTGFQNCPDGEKYGSQATNRVEGKYEQRYHIRRDAIKLTDKSMFKEAAFKERKSSMPAKFPHFSQDFKSKVSQLKSGSQVKRRKSIAIDTSDSGMLPSRPDTKRVLAVDREIEMKHQLAQQIIELINDNERCLTVSDSKLTAYLGRSSQGRQNAGSCLMLVDSLERDWMTRFKNIAQIFELISSRRDPSLPADLLLTFFKTPKSLSKTFDFSTDRTQGTSISHINN